MRSGSSKDVNCAPGNRVGGDHIQSNVSRTVATSTITFTQLRLAVRLAIVDRPVGLLGLMHPCGTSLIIESHLTLYQRLFLTLYQGLFPRHHGRCVPFAE